MLEQPLFGQRVRELRIAHGMSQAALAEPGMSTSYLSRLESGTRQPTTKVVAYLAERLGVHTSTFDGSASSVITQVLARGLSDRDWQSSDEIFELLKDAVESGADIDPALRWQLLWLLADVYTLRCDRVAELGTLTSLVQLGDKIGVAELQVRARVKLSRLHRMTGSPELARTVAAEALALAQEDAVQPSDLARVLLSLVPAEAESGRLDKAREHVDQLCALLEGSPDTAPTLLAEARWAAASVRVRQGEGTGASTELEKAIANLDSRDDILLWTRLRLAAASLYLQVTPHRTDRAAAYLNQISVPMDLVGTRANQQEYLVVQAQLAFHQGNFEEAGQLCDKLQSEPSLLAFRDQVRLDMLRMRLRVKSGSLAGAVEEITALATRLQQTSNSDLSAEAWQTLSEALSEAALNTPAGDIPAVNAPAVNIPAVNSPAVHSPAQEQ